MAFLPRVHNREVPCANKPALLRHRKLVHQEHLHKLAMMESRIDNKWGTSHNGLKEYKEASYAHVRDNLKRAQLQGERLREVEAENFMLLRKIAHIVDRSPDNRERDNREIGGGLRLTRNMVPVIDHYVSKQASVFGAATVPTSLNIGYRMREHKAIQHENSVLIRRLLACRPTYSVESYREPTSPPHTPLAPSPPAPP